MNGDFSSFGIKVPEILLPNPTVDLHKWAVVACDQYTSQPEYWDEVARFVGSDPSTYHLIYPEVFLGRDDEAERIRRIHHKMRSYLEEQILVSPGSGFIYLERQTAGPIARKGLMVTLDLECYDYKPGSQTFVRATEGTVLDRIPPRVRIREGAPLESPHIMVLIDDPDFQVIEPLEKAKAQYPKLYETPLMMKGGKVAGYFINRPADMAQIYQGLSFLAEQAHFEAKYGVTNTAVLLFAVGDGNHSLATAKAVWEKMKEKAGRNRAVLSHPARYALVELVNIHDRALQFEPIHRVMFHVELEELTVAMGQYFGNDHFRLTRFSNGEDLFERMRSIQERNAPTREESHVIGYCSGSENGILQIGHPRFNLEVGSLQAFIDQYVKTHPHTSVDYIHGEQVVAELGGKPGNIGFYLPVMSKQALFQTVIVDGVLPRKTFSLGEAEEKRFYLECRKIS